MLAKDTDGALVETLSGPQASTGLMFRAAARFAIDDVQHGAGAARLRFGVLLRRAFGSAAFAVALAISAAARLAKGPVRWMPMEKWDACAFSVHPEDLEGRVCYGGLDLSSTTDITALVLVFPPEDGDNGKYEVLPYFWIPEDNIDLRVRRDHVPYDVWHQQGFLETTEGNVVHYGYIEKFIEKLG